MEIIFATNNRGKVREVKNILSDFNTEVYSLEDRGINIDIVEDGSTFEENAIKKAVEIYKLTKTPVISDDSGLEVYALNMRPSIYSARYAGENATGEMMCVKLLNEMKGIEDRRARFVSVIAYVNENGEVFTFRGEAYGSITTQMLGNEGFGYDPVFMFDPLNKTFSQLTLEEKNKISHRAIALEKFKLFFEEKYI